MISRTFTFVFVCAIALHMAFALSESDFPEEDRVVLRPHELLFDATDIHERNARAFKDLAGVSFGTSYMFGSVSSCTAANISPVMSADGRTIVSRKLACVTSTGASPNTNMDSLDGLGPLPTATNLPSVRSDTSAPATTSSTVVYQWRDNPFQEGWDTAYLPNSKTFAFSFAISNDAEWIAQAISDTPASSVRNVDVEVYKRYRARQDNLWYRVHRVSLTNVNQADEAMSLSLSADGLYLSIVYLDGGSTKTPQISVYKRNADFTYSSLTVSSLPTINVNFISHAMTPDAKHIVVPLTTLNTFAYYTRSDVDAFTYSQVLVPFPGGSLTGSPTFQLVDMAATGERIFIQAMYTATPVVLTLTRARFNDDQSWVIENVFSSRKLAAARASTYYGREVLLVDSSNQISYAALNPTTRVWTATDVLTLKGQAATIASGGSYFFLLGISSEGVQLGIIEPARPRITSPVATTRWRVDTRVTVRWTPFVNYATTPSTATVYLVDAETNAVLIQQVCINGREGAVTLNLLGLAPARTVFVAIVPTARGMSGMSMTMAMTSKRSVSGSGYIADRWDDINDEYCQITYVSKSENRNDLVKPVQFYGTPSMDSRAIPATLQTFAPTGNWLQSENFHLTQ